MADFDAECNLLEKTTSTLLFGIDKWTKPDLIYLPESRWEVKVEGFKFQRK